MSRIRSLHRVVFEEPALHRGLDKNRRKPPLRDEKILTAWNGLTMLTGKGRKHHRFCL